MMSGKDSGNLAFSIHNSELIIPEIRFKGFSGEWKSFRMGEIADVLDGDRGHNYPNGDDLKEQGHTLFLSASNVTKNGFKFETRQYITQDKSESLGNGKLISDDIILTSRGSIGHIAWYNEGICREIPFARINSGMLILRAKSHIAPSIISHYLKSPKGKKKIEVISFGSAQPQLTKASVSDYSVSIPSDKPEQTAIGNYFQKLDNLINQHQQKHDKLSSIKKAMLEKMFPKQGETVPEIRFKGFGGEWEEIRVGEIAKTTIGEFVKQTKQNPDSPYPVFNGGRSFTGHYDDYNNEGDKILVSARGANAGFVNYQKTRFWAGNSCYSIDINIKTAHNTIFVFFSIKRTQHLFTDFQQAANIPSVSKADVEKFKFMTPTFEEQTKIGNCFQKLDTLINQHQQQLTKLNNIKQACLSKMFV